MKSDNQTGTRKPLVLAIVALSIFILLSLCSLLGLLGYFLFAKPSADQKENDGYSEVSVDGYCNAYNLELSNRMVGYLIVRAYDSALLLSMLKGARKVDTALTKHRNSYPEAHIDLQDATDIFRTDEYRGSLPTILFQGLQVSAEEKVFGNRKAACDAARLLFRDTIECNSAETDKFFARTKLIDLLNSSVSSANKNGEEIRKLVDESRSAASNLDKQREQAHPYLFIQQNQEAECLERRSLNSEALALREKTLKLAEERKLKEIDHDFLKVSLVRCLASQRDYQKALAITEALSKSHPDSSYYLASSAFLKMYLKRFDESEAEYRKALSMENPPVWTRESLIGLLVMMKKYDSALAECQKLIEKDKPESKYYWTRGFVYEKLDRKTEAERDFKQAIKLAPDPCAGALLRSLYYLRCKKLKEALEEQTVALALVDKSVAETGLVGNAEPDAIKGYVYELRASTYRALGRGKEAEADVRASKELNNNSYSEYMGLYQL